MERKESELVVKVDTRVDMKGEASPGSPLTSLFFKCDKRCEQYKRNKKMHRTPRRQKQNIPCL